MPAVPDPIPPASTQPGLRAQASGELRSVVAAVRNLPQSPVRFALLLSAGVGLLGGVLLALSSPVASSLLTAGVGMSQALWACLVAPAAGLVLLHFVGRGRVVRVESFSTGLWGVGFLGLLLILWLHLPWPGTKTPLLPNLSWGAVWIVLGVLLTVAAPALALWAERLATLDTPGTRRLKWLWQVGAQTNDSLTATLVMAGGWGLGGTLVATAAAVVPALSFKRGHDTPQRLLAQVLIFLCLAVIALFVRHYARKYRPGPYALGASFVAALAGMVLLSHLLPPQLLPAQRLNGYLVFPVMVQAEHRNRTVAVDLKRRRVVALTQTYLASTVDGRFVLENTLSPGTGTPSLRVIHDGIIRNVFLPYYPGPGTLRRSGVMNESGMFGYWLADVFVTVDGLSGKVRQLRGLPSSAPDTAIDASGQSAFASLSGRIVRLDLLSGHLAPIGSGYAPSLSRQGKLAWISTDHRDVVIADDYGQHQFHCGMVGLLGLAWSPDGMYLAYLYGFGPGGWLSGLSGEYGVGVIDAKGTHSWRILPVMSQTMSIRTADLTDGSRLLWLEVLPPAAVCASEPRM